MTVDLQQVINSSLSLRLVSSLARSLPPWLGYRIADAIAEQIARRRNSKLVQAVRLNQWVANGEVLEGEMLDRVIRKTFHCWGHSLFDLYHYNHDFEATRQLIVFDSSFEQITERAEFDRRGLLIAGLHLSNFDLILQWLVRGGLKLLVLTIPDPQGGRRIEYEIRKQTGMNLMPASASALRHAVKHLQKGGMVLTGIDRPIEKPGVMPRFFNRPAPLPVHHIFLALKARVPIIITVIYLQADGKYHVFASDPIEMDLQPDHSDALLRNAEKVLDIAEKYIRRTPHQWSVPLPVWPEITDLVPS